jgi:FKBP-type peptidyl-prolyl cis-trans isomerase FkpA
MPSRTARLRRRAISLLPLGLLAACLTGTDTGSPSNPATDTYAASLGVNIAQMTKISDALYIQDLIVGPGSGTTAAVGKTVSVTYTGWLVDGTQFESNIGGTPLVFPLGAGRVIQGWEIGILGMRPGGKRRLVIGSDLAYGSGGNGIIRPNSTIVFDVQLLSVQ